MQFLINYNIEIDNLYNRKEIKDKLVTNTKNVAGKFEIDIKEAKKEEQKLIFECKTRNLKNDLSFTLDPDGEFLLQIMSVNGDIYFRDENYESFFSNYSYNLSSENEIRCSYRKDMQSKDINSLSNKVLNLLRPIRDRLKTELNEHFEKKFIIINNKIWNRIDNLNFYLSKKVNEDIYEIVFSKNFSEKTILNTIFYNLNEIDNLFTENENKKINFSYKQFKQNTKINKDYIKQTSLLKKNFFYQIINITTFINKNLFSFDSEFINEYVKIYKPLLLFRGYENYQIDKISISTIEKTINCPINEITENNELYSKLENIIYDFCTFLKNKKNMNNIQTVMDDIQKKEIQYCKYPNKDFSQKNIEILNVLIDKIENLDIILNNNANLKF